MVETEHIIFNNDDYQCNLSETCTSIIDSYRLKYKSDMYLFLNDLKCANTKKELALNQRETKDMVNEWAVHNLFYNIGILKDRTRSVDLNYPQSKLMKMLYSIISLFYIY